ncbi:hypothetical protein Fot_48406 [Forsythia ovata]|uniref:Secreted protein n=1 Tax=Forsythia ovata TaxID=205694 RepID=A0ABD1Q8Y0_9LAMI
MAHTHCGCRAVSATTVWLPRQLGISATTGWLPRQLGNHSVVAETSRHSYTVVAEHVKHLGNHSVVAEMLGNHSGTKFRWLLRCYAIFAVTCGGCRLTNCGYCD